MEEFLNIEDQTKQDPFIEGPTETTEDTCEELRKKVEKYYETNDISEDLIKQFVIHNDQVEYFVNRFSEEENFNEKEKEIALLY